MMVMVGIAADISYDPLKWYFEEMKWDGTARIDQFFQRVFGLEDEPHLTETSRVMFLQAVQRAVIPGPNCKADVVVVLSGPQGTYKSTVFRALCPRQDWFSDNIPHDLSSKDAKAHIGSKFIVEMAELFSLKRTDILAFKSFISTPVDIFRPSYGRRDVTRPRRCIFVGTTNNVEVLGDATGGRRFSIVEIEQRADLDWVRAHRDQLWAEAKVLFDQYRLEGRPLLTSDQERIVNSKNVHHEIETVYSVVAEAWAKEVGDRYFTLYQAARFMLPAERLSDLEKEKLRIGDALRKADFESKIVRMAPPEGVRAADMPPRRLWARREVHTARLQMKGASIDVGQMYGGPAGAPPEEAYDVK
jgi:predicted P-loop ATPase